MSPIFPINNHTDHCFTNAVFFSKQFLFCSVLVFLSNFNNDFFRKFRAFMTASSWKIFRMFSGWIIISKKMISPVLNFPINGIIFGSPQKQMIGIYARWVVAFVKHPKTVWNFPKVQSPRKSMRLPNGFFCLELSVKCFWLISSPFPTISQFWNVWHLSAIFVHLFPKSLFGGLKSLMVNVHKTKNHHLTKVLPAQIEPQLSGNGLNVLCSSVFCGCNKALLIITQPLNFAI